MGRAAEIADVDAFLAQPKVLMGPPPTWVGEGWRGNLQATWNVADVHGAAIATLRFTCGRFSNRSPTISLIFRNKPVWRIDIEDPPRPHPNPRWAGNFNLPPVVIGSHEHRWPYNRDHVAQIAPEWDLPARRPLHGPIKRLTAGLYAFAAEVNIALESDQRHFDVPPQSGLEFYP